jgi:hypothetical protein
VGNLDFAAFGFLICFVIGGSINPYALLRGDLDTTVVPSVTDKRIQSQPAAESAR